MLFLEFIEREMPGVQPKTREGYRSLATNLALFLGREPALEALRPLQCLRFRVWLDEEKKGSTARAYWSRFCRVMRAAYRQGWVGFNIDEYSEPAPQPAEPPRHRYLTRDQLLALESASCRHRYSKDVFLLACYTGLRISDIESLRWSHIQARGGKQYVVKRQQKTGRMLQTPLSAKACAILERYRSESPQVFALPSRTTLFSDLKAMARQVGVEPGLMTFNVARYTFTALMLQAGVDVYVTAQCCGNVRAYTPNIPIQMSDEVYDQAMDSFDRMLG